MKKIISILTAIFILQMTGWAQAPASLKKVMTFKINREGGANGAGIVWHPKQQKYYVGMAGNESFPLLVFNAAGKLLSDDMLECMTDLRGMWYNAKVSSVQCNGYDTYGWREYKLDAKGIPSGTKILYDGQYQPETNSVGTYSPTSNQVYFLGNENGMSLSVYNMSDGAYNKSIKLHLQNSTSNEANDQPGLDEEYNSTTVLYTGLLNKEFALLNVSKERVEFYNLKGYMTLSKNFPSETTLEDRFNFAYANGILWIFNKEEREWTGYK